MSRILKPVCARNVEYVHQVVARYFIDEHEFRIVEYNLGNAFTGNIDILAADTVSLFLVTINRADFAGALLRSLTGYRWFCENRDFLRRVYPPEDVNIDLPVELIILSEEFPPEIPSVLGEVCSVPLRLYRYRLFGQEEDPDIFVEEICSEGTVDHGPSRDLDALRKELAIEPAGLSDEDIRDFLKAMKV